MVDQDSTFSHYFTLLAPLRPHYPQLYNAMAHLPRRRDDPQRKRHGSFSRKSPRKTPQDEKDENSRLCVICATEKPGTDYLSPEQAPCYCGDIQESATCRQCMARYMTMQIEERPDVPLACMHCGRKWSFEKARRMLPRDVAALYDSILAQRCMKAIPGFLLCPYPDCTAGAIHNTSCPDFPCVQCQACSRSSCQACRTPWQKGHSCAEFSSSREASRRTFRALREKGARRCPRCHYVIMKAGGCNHMCCKSVRYRS